MANPQVTMQTSAGTLTIELFEQEAPVTVQNLLSYVDAGFYNGTIFHRVISNFMIQGGGFTPAMEQKMTNPPIANESGNGLSNERGTLAMARTNNPNSATAQFFINVKDNGFLDKANAQDGHGYCVFGKVTEGMDVIDAIKEVPTGNRSGHSDVPEKDVVIESVSRA